MMNILLDTWATTMWRACWEGGLVVLVVWMICRLLPSMPARFQCWLWRLAVLKFMVVLLMPWFLNVPLLPAHRSPERSVEMTTVVPTVQEPLSQTSETPVPLPMSTPTPLPILPVAIFLLWVVGVGWGLIRLLAALYGTVRLRRRGHGITCTSLVEQLAIQGRLFGLRSLPRLLAVEGSGSPMLIGIFRPTIVVPAETLGQLSVSEQKMVLGHELAHIRRGDLFWSTVAAFVRAVFFFHPLVWLSERQLKLIQEVAADELAIAKHQHDAVAYGKLLVSVVGKFGHRPPISAISVETAGTTHSLARRLVAMTHFGRASRRVVITSSIVLGTVVLLGLVPWRLVAAEPRQDKANLQGVSMGERKAHSVATADETMAIVEIKRLGGVVNIYPEGVALVDLSKTRVTDSDLTHLQGLEYLSRVSHFLVLDLHDTQITDLGLESLRRLIRIGVLDLGHTKITDAGLRHLRELHGLTDCSLARKVAVHGANRQPYRRTTEEGCSADFAREGRDGCAGRTAARGRGSTAIHRPIATAARPTTRDRCGLGNRRRSSGSNRQTRCDHAVHRSPRWSKSARTSAAPLRPVCLASLFGQ